MKIKEGFKGQRSVVLPKIILERMRGEMLFSSLYITDIGYFPHAAHHYVRRGEAIGEYVLIHCVAGKGHYKVGEVAHDVTENQYFILPPGSPHEYHADESDPWTIYWIHYSGTHASAYCPGELAPISVDASADSRMSGRINLFEELLESVSSWYDTDRLRYATALLHHYLASLRFIGSYRRGETRHQDIAEGVIHYMTENLERPLTLAEISGYAGLSTSYLSALFKAQTGRAPMEYLGMVRVRKACEMLEHTDLKINQICFKTGISDPYYFSRLFSKVMGCSPKAYREKRKSMFASATHTPPEEVRKG